MTFQTKGLGDKPLKVVLVGTGMVSPIHLRGWQRLPGITVVGLQSRTRSKAEERAREFGIANVYDDYEEMLDAEKPDIADICSPQEVHLAQVRAAAERGIHVKCQKPMAGSLEEAREIARVVEAAGIRFMVHENFRFRIWYRELKRQLDSGIIGTPYYCRSDARIGGTVLTAEHPERPWNLVRQPFFAELPRFLILESMIHQLDVCRFLFGEPRGIYTAARRVSPHVKAEDLVSMLLTFDNMHAVVERSYASRGYRQPPLVTEWVAVEGDKGSLFLEADGTMRVEVDAPGDRRTIRPEYPLEDAYANSYAGAIQHFAECMRSGASFETDAEDNLRTLALTFAAYDSWRNNQVVTLD